MTDQPERAGQIDEIREIMRQEKEQPDPLIPQSMEKVMELAEWYEEGGLIPRDKHGPLYNRQAAAVIILTGREIGIAPMQSLRLIQIIYGRIAFSASLKVAMVKRSPACEYFQLVSTSEKSATYETQRVGEPKPTKITWTIEQAEKAGLIRSDSAWHSHRAAMLRARASSALSDAVYQDVVGGMLTTDEAAEIARTAREDVIAAIDRAVDAEPPETVDVSKEPASAEVKRYIVQRVERGGGELAAVVRAALDRELGSAMLTIGEAQTISDYLDRVEDADQEAPITVEQAEIPAQG